MIAIDIVRFIELRRLPLHSEKECQAALEQEFRAAGVAYEREVRLGDGDVVDFMVGSVAVEMKIKGQRREIYRQCERYCQHDRVEGLVLATNAAMGMPTMINGRKVFVARLGKAWL